MQNQCVSNEQNHFSGTFNATIFIVAGGGGAALHPFTTIPTNWSLKRDHDYGFTKLTAFNRSSLLFEYKHSADGKVVDRFTIYRERPDVLGCDQTKIRHCPHITLADQPWANHVWLFHCGVLWVWICIIVVVITRKMQQLCLPVQVVRCCSTLKSRNLMQRDNRKMGPLVVIELSVIRSYT